MMKRSMMLPCSSSTVAFMSMLMRISAAESRLNLCSSLWSNALAVTLALLVRYMSAFCTLLDICWAWIVSSRSSSESALRAAASYSAVM